MRNFVVLSAILVSVAFAAFSAHVVVAAESDRPNVLLILVDNVGPDDLIEPKGNGHRHLYAIAKGGATFASAYAAQPAGSAAVAALLTGKCPARLHLTSHLPQLPHSAPQPFAVVSEGQLPVEEVTLAELLKQQGYVTGLFGTWGLGDAGFGPDAQGFDVSLQSPNKVQGTAPVDQRLALAAAATKFIESSQQAGQPFFCYLRLPTADGPTSGEALDVAIGEIMLQLDKHDLAKNSIVILAGTNGDPRETLSERSIRVPLIVRWPGIVAPGTTIASPVVLTDLMPTLLVAAGIDPATTVGPLDGVSLVPALKGEVQPARTLYWHFPHYANSASANSAGANSTAQSSSWSQPCGAIREGDWKLVEQLEDGAAQLFNLVSDPDERNNLIMTESERAAPMLASLRAWRVRVGAQMPESGANTKSVSASQPLVTPASGDIRLHAKDAIVHGQKLQYEPQPHKNVLGYWVHVTDWAEWEFDVPVSGVYEVEVQQGCGTGYGGSEILVEVGDAKLRFVVDETGHFQHMILRTIGTASLAPGKNRLAIKPQTKPGGAVMDIRRVVLRPVDVRSVK